MFRDLFGGNKRINEYKKRKKKKKKKKEKKKEEKKQTNEKMLTYLRVTFIIILQENYLS